VTRSASDLPLDVVTLVDVLRWRSAHQPEQRAYTFLTDGEFDEVHITYAELDQRARAIAVELREAGAVGERAVLLYPPGLDYIAAFFGCLYAGVIAVPAYPPRLNRPTPRLEAIVANSGASVVLALSQTLSNIQKRLDNMPYLTGLRWLATDTLDVEGADAWQHPGTQGDDLAFLQYTSGSTSTPKGVMLSHSNLLHNLGIIQRVLSLTTESRGVIWLPPYHDMGLIGGILAPLFVGFPVVLMPPIAFLQRPMRWLEAVSRYGATVSGGPNFAYEACLVKSTPEQRAALDLSRWEAPFSGAEPIRRDTLERFAAAFAPAGFRLQAFCPGFGLAETTLVVTSRAKDEELIFIRVEAASLEQHEVVLAAPDSPTGRDLVGCGPTNTYQQVEIVDPATMLACPEGRVGEIWVASPSVAQGYWDRPEETSRTFQASLADTGVGPFLRTGDLGFVLAGELYVTGRLKDLIIIRGRNHYPQDIELTVARSHPALIAGAGAAFVVEGEHEEQLFIAQELNHRHRNPDIEEIAGAIRAAVAEEHELHLYGVLLVREGHIPKTSSGKIQRHAARLGFLDETLPLVGRSILGEQSQATAETEAPPPVEESFIRKAVLAVNEPTARRMLLNIYLQEQVARLLRMAPSRLNPQQPLSSLGLDSLMVMELKNEVESSLGVVLPMALLLEGPSIEQVASEIISSLEGGAQPVQLEAASQAPVGLYPLSYGQRSLWFLQQLAPESTAYTIASAVRLRQVNVAALRQAFQALVDRHPALRTIFTEAEGDVLQQIQPRLELALEETDASEWSEEALQARLSDEVQQPFDLARGPLLRLQLFKRGAAEWVLLFTVHHSVVDLWSLVVLLDELRQIYEATLEGRWAALAPLAQHYPDYQQQQARMIAGPEGERLWSYWAQQLAGELPLLNLPTDRPRPPFQSYRGAAHPFTIDAAVARQLQAIARETGATLYTVLLAAFQVLLWRYTGQEDILVGSPAAGRSRAAWAGVVGYFVTPVVLRADLSGNPPFTGFLEQVRRTVLDALAHQEYPFPLLVERLQPERDPSRSPLFQALFVLEKPHRLDDEGAAALVLGQGGAKLALGPLQVESYPLEQRVAQFDLTLMVVETGEQLQAALEYSTDLFDAETIERMAANFQVLLASIVVAPQQPIGSLAFLAPAERELLLETWNQTEAPYPHEQCIHQLFELQVEYTPKSVAVIAGEESLNYAELNSRANRLARLLQAHGVGPEVCVGVCLARSLDLAVSLLAVLKAGGAYVPLDANYPAARLAFMLEDTQARVILTQERLQAVLPPNDATIICLDGPEAPVLAEGEGETDPESGVTPENLAYLIYTSGSTGRPKGVAIAHRNAVAMLAWAREQFGPEMIRGVLASTSINFDLSVFEFFVPLGWGGTIILAENALQLPTLPAADQVTLVNTVPSAMAELLRMHGVPASVRRVNLAGEPLRTQLVEQIYATTQVQEVFDLYGPSEDTTYSTFTLRRPGQRATIGRPISNTQMYLLAADGQPVPLGVPGELYIGGDGLARGYYKRPDLTAERFLPNPFNNEPGARLYRTGDLVRYTPDGNLEFLGRIDHQVKIRGFRIELGEIEAALRQHPAVAEAVVMARSEGGEQRLVAYLTARPEQTLDRGEVRRFLKKTLPDYMVPAVLVVLEQFPLTPNGKIDRRALPAPEMGSDQQGEGGEAPRTAVETMVAELWSEVLRLAQVARHTNFFEVGGHSLLATRLVSRLRDTFEFEVPVRALFLAPTVAGLAEWIEANRTPNGHAALPPLVPVARDGELPLSFAQQRLWFLDQLEPGSALYNMPAAVRLHGPLDVGALERSLAEIVRRHEALRTTFAVAGGQPVQVIAPELAFQMERLDLRHLPDAAREREALQLVRAEARRPFDLTTGPLLRVTLVQLGAQDFLLLLTLHHIVADGWSLTVLIQELLALYPAFAAGQPAPLPELPIQYADFAAWQRQNWQGERLASAMTYWLTQLADLPVLALPTDKPRPPLQSFRGAHVPLRLSGALSAELHALSQREGATLFMTLLAGFQLLLARYSGQDDIVVGTPVLGRSHSELERLIGVFINTLVLRTDLSGNPDFRELLGRVREVTLDGFAHQDLPFEQLVEALQQERDLSRHPLFQVMFALNEPVEEALQLPNLAVTVLPDASEVAKFDLTLTLTDSADGLVGSLEYNTDLFERATIERMAAHLERLLTGLAAEPGRPVASLSLLSEGERQQVLQKWSGVGGRRGESGCLHERFEQQAARTPDAVALIFEEQRLSYQELNSRANQLAHQLQAWGVGPEVCVGVCLTRSVEVVVALLAILKAGGVYLPLDPEAPPERLAFLLKDASARVLLTEASVRDRLTAQPAQVMVLDQLAATLAGQSSANPSGGARPDNLAYIIYTSGSTGQPKGVGVSHQAIVGHCEAVQAHYGLQPTDRVLQFASFNFDASLEQFLPPLLAGAAVVLRGAEVWNTARFDQKLLEAGLTVADFTTAHWHFLVQEWAQRPDLPALPLRLVTVGGEAMQGESVRLWHQTPLRGVRLLNAYGPTEAVITATTYEVPAGPGSNGSGVKQRLPIGRPLPNHTTYILDEAGQPVPPGVPGELCLGGVCLARGYLGRPALTAERFVPDPFGGEPGARLYRTGDLARYLSDGTIEFLGRRDDQVKIRGFRIEPGEVEATLLRHPSVRSAVVLAHEYVRGHTRDQQLVAYVVSQPGEQATVDELRAFVKQQLPEYMVPGAIVALDSLPLRPSGKVDRRALPRPEQLGLDGAAFVAPRTPTEETLASLWADLLGLSQVSVQANFFELGGHSLLATQLLSRIWDNFGVDVPLRAFFEAPTVAGLAVTIAQHQAADMDEATLLELLQEIGE
jgi:amino acid adenylation domain-containing protein